MKIALVHMRHSDTGGTELFLNEMARYLAEKGEEVTIICRTHVAPPHPDVSFVTLKGLSLGKAHRIWKFARQVERHLADTHYDFVYGLGKTWSNDMLRIGGGTHLHFVQSMKHGKLTLKDKVAIAIERRAMSPGAYRHIVANSFKSAREVREAYGVPEDKISVIHNFVDTGRFSRERVQEQAAVLEDRLALDRNQPVFLFLGSGYERKGLRQALTAFARLDFPATLLIAGRESNEAAFKALAAELGVRERCRFLGPQKHPEVLFSVADCYVLPTHYEPFGFTVIEALSCGIPVVTTENCGAKEVLNPDVSTVVGEGVDPEEIYSAMVYWAERRGDRGLATACRALALTLDVNEVMERNYQQILTVYEQKKD
ncbi:glycosyltransferase family 4 protein [Marinobacter sp.]|uniref:glycosyltransferase family 4 protein n=1 Tax=Marinobacter sp. TaxID=50741 RepID=UPI0035645701